MNYDEHYNANMPHKSDTITIIEVLIAVAVVEKRRSTTRHRLMAPPYFCPN